MSKAGDQVPVIPLFEAVGKADKVAPEQIGFTAVNVGVTLGFTVTTEVANEVQPVPFCVNVKVAVPAETAVTTPALLTEATAGLLLNQLPPADGDNDVVAPTQIEFAPVILTVGNGVILITKLPFIVEEQPPTVLVATTV